MVSKLQFCFFLLFCIFLIWKNISRIFFYKFYRKFFKSLAQKISELFYNFESVIKELWHMEHPSFYPWPADNIGIKFLRFGNWWRPRVFLRNHLITPSSSSSSRVSYLAKNVLTLEVYGWFLVWGWLTKSSIQLKLRVLGTKMPK